MDSTNGQEKESMVFDTFSIHFEAVEDRLSGFQFV